MTAVIDAHVHVWDLAAHPQPWTESVPLLNRSFLVQVLDHAGKPDDAGSRAALLGGTARRWYLEQSQ